MRRDFNYPPSLALLATAASLLDDRARATMLYRLLSPFAERNVVFPVYSPGALGSAHRYLGLLAATEGDVERAATHFEAALVMNARLGARPALARTQRDYARLLLVRGRPGDAERARALRAAGLELADACGMTLLRAELAEPEPAPAGVPPPALAAADVVAPSGASVQASLRREVEFWIVSYGADSFQLKDTKGLAFLQTLLRHPGREFHVLDLSGGGEPLVEGSGRPASGDAGELLDPSARAAYRRRLEDLREELEEAQRWSDLERAARAQQEIDFLTDELARAVGLGGRSRTAGVVRRARARQREPHDRRGGEEDRGGQPRAGPAPHGRGADGLLLRVRARPARARRLALLSYFFLQRGSVAWIAASCSSVRPRPLAPITNPHTRSWVGSEPCVARLAGAQAVRHLTLAVCEDLGLPLRVDAEPDELPVVSVRIVPGPALDHGLERQNLQDGVHRIARRRERAGLRDRDGLPEARAVAVEDVEVRALDLLALQQAVEVAAALACGSAEAGAGATSATARSRQNPETRVRTMARALDSARFSSQRTSGTTGRGGPPICTSGGRAARPLPRPVAHDPVGLARAAPGPRGAAARGAPGSPTSPPSPGSGCRG